MFNPHYTFIILTYNEELHLPRLLNSIRSLNAAICILDSGSTDQTLQIAEISGAQVKQHTFINHPQQWHHALVAFEIKTPWVICIDADQIVTDELKQQLSGFRDEDYRDINGIYFNRKNYFKGAWIKHGGYFPFYLLKMFRYGTGYSDLNENMDHRFIVPGKTLLWKDGHLLEENLKENNIRFWIDKHNRYSDLLAHEEVERKLKLRTQTLRPKFWGSPDERTAWLKQLWWQMPLFVRPAVYFIYRYIFRLGILDGRQGFIFHFLQAFWFRLIVDIKIKEILNAQTIEKSTDP
ncbi:MAG TPA: glycosyltransferase family 2 protein [Pedobacter sp.]